MRFFEPLAAPRLDVRIAIIKAVFALIPIPLKIPIP